MCFVWNNNGQFSSINPTDQFEQAGTVVIFEIQANTTQQYTLLLLHHHFIHMWYYLLTAVCIVCCCHLSFLYAYFTWLVGGRGRRGSLEEVSDFDHPDRNLSMMLKPTPKTFHNKLRTAASYCMCWCLITYTIIRAAIVFRILLQAVDCQNQNTCLDSSLDAWKIPKQCSRN